jgi:hypothetical protein
VLGLNPAEKDFTTFIGQIIRYFEIVQFQIPQVEGEHELAFDFFERGLGHVVKMQTVIFSIPFESLRDI